MDRVSVSVDPAHSLKPCRACGRPVAWCLSRGKPISAAMYQQQKYCSVQCAGEASRGPRGAVKARWDAALQRIEERERRGPERPRVVPPPWGGYPCAVCGFPVRKGHPLHYAEPKRAEIRG